MKNKTFFSEICKLKDKKTFILRKYYAYLFVMYFISLKLRSKSQISCS